MVEDEEEFSLELITFGVTEVVTPCETDLLVEHSTGPINSQIYLYVLFEWLRVDLCF